MVRRAERAMESFIPVTEADKRIRLDFKDAAHARGAASDDGQPRRGRVSRDGQADSRDPGRLAAVRSEARPRPEDPSRHVIDERTFNVWLSLGPDGDTIPTESGRLTRDALLRTTLLGAGYYRARPSRMAPVCAEEGDPPSPEPDRDRIDATQHARQDPSRSVLRRCRDIGPPRRGRPPRPVDLGSAAPVRAASDGPERRRQRQGIPDVPCHRRNLDTQRRDGCSPTTSRTPALGPNGP